MSTEALNKIIKEVNALTPQERHELIDRLAQEEQNSPEQIMRKPGILKGTVKYMAPDFEGVTAGTISLREWLNEARKMRAELPITSDSVDILRELRDIRSTQ